MLTKRDVYPPPPHVVFAQIRVILDQIRGRTYEDALMILEYMPHRACEPILKLLVSV